MYEFRAEHCILESCHLPQGVTTQNVPEHLIPTDDNSCAGLPCTLKLAVGAQVTLICKIMCEDGLVNGVRRVIVGFKWNSNQYQSGSLSAAVLVKCHDRRVGRIQAIQVRSADGTEAVEIQPISAKFFAPQGVTMQENTIAIATMLGCNYPQSKGTFFSLI